MFVGVVASVLPGFTVTIPRCQMTSWENGICFRLTGVSVVNSMDTSRRLEAFMSSKLLLVREINQIICMYIVRKRRRRRSKGRGNFKFQSFNRLCQWYCQ